MERNLRLLYKDLFTLEQKPTFQFKSIIYVIPIDSWDINFVTVLIWE